MCVFYLITSLFIIHTAPSKSSDEKEESKSNEQERGESSNNEQQEDDQSNNILHHSSIPNPSINTNYYYSGSNQGQYQYYHDFDLLPGNHTRDNNNQYHSQTPLQYYPPNNVPSFIDYTQNDIIQNNIPGSYLQPTPNNMTVHQLACNLGFDTYQYQPHMTYMRNLQQHNVAAMSTGKRKFVPDEAVSNEYNTHNQPKHRKYNQDPIAASAIDFIGPPTNVDDINITSNPMVFQGNVADKAQGQSISRMKHPKGSIMIPSTFSTKPITNNVPCPPLCGAVFSRTGELVTFNNGQVKQIWSFQQINEGGSCNVQKFPKTIADLTEMNRSLQALKLEHALETNGSSCAKDDSSTSSNNSGEGDSNSSTSRTKTLANDSSCTKDNSSTLCTNKEGGSTSNNSRSIVETISCRIPFGISSTSSFALLQTQQISPSRPS